MCVLISKETSPSICAYQPFALVPIGFLIFSHDISHYAELIIGRNIIIYDMGTVGVEGSKSNRCRKGT